MNPEEVRIAPLSPSQFLAQEEAKRHSFERQDRQQQEEIQRLRQNIRDLKQQVSSTEKHNHDSRQRRLAKKVAKKATSREKRLQHWERSGKLLEKPIVPHALRYTWDHVEWLWEFLYRSRTDE